MGEPNEIRTRGVSRVSEFVSGRSHSMPNNFIKNKNKI
jgi:hypothetical protein